jgi:hypothetical protein
MKTTRNILKDILIDVFSIQIMYAGAVSQIEKYKSDAYMNSVMALMQTSS